MVLADEFATYAGAAAALLVAGAGGIIRLGNIAVKKQIDSLKAEVGERIEAAKLELADRRAIDIDAAVKGFGEAVSAIRQKVTDVELWNRDNFVNIRTFDAIVADIRRLEDKIDRRFDSVDRKLSKMNGDSEN